MNRFDKLSLSFISSSRSRALSLVLLMAALHHSVYADDARGGQPSTDESAVHLLQEHFPSGATDTGSKADAALKEAASARDLIEHRYTERQKECYRHFFVSDCLDRAQVDYRTRLVRVSQVEVEARRFQRNLHAQETGASREQRERARLESLAKDQAQREQNRIEWQRRQVAFQQSAAERQQSGAPRSVRSPAHPPEPENAASLAQRQQLVLKQAQKIQDAAEHRAKLVQNHLEKEADRARRAKERAAKSAPDTGSAAVVAPPVVSKPQ